MRGHQQINVLVLAVSKFDSEGLDDGPLCLAEIAGKSVIERIIERLSKLSELQFNFAFLETDDKKYHLSQIAAILQGHSRSFVVPEKTKGSLCTALLAACTLNADSQLLIVSANELVDVDFVKVVESFVDRRLDAGTIVFKSVQPRYSYVRVNESGAVLEASQKRPISQNATAGIFWFNRTSHFVNGAKTLIRKDTMIDGAFYIAPVFNELILENKSVGVYEINNSQYTPLKTNSQVKSHVAGV